MRSEILHFRGIYSQNAVRRFIVGFDIVAGVHRLALLPHVWNHWLSYTTRTG
jgi:hypothetical protein